MDKIGMTLGILGIISFILNIIFILIMAKFGKPVIEQIKGKSMKNPTYIVRVFNKNRAEMELVDFKDGIIHLDKKTYIKDPERIIRHKPFDMAFYMAEDCRPLNLAEIELVLDPEVYTRQLELAEMAGAARMVERLVQELMKALTPWFIGMGIGLIVVAVGFFMIHQQNTSILADTGIIKNMTAVLVQNPTLVA
jgi:hypothetical protein